LEVAGIFGGSIHSLYKPQEFQQAKERQLPFPPSSK